jgi:hypothetical protein
MNNALNRKRDCLVAIAQIDDKIKQHERCPTAEDPQALAILRLVRTRKLRELDIINKELEHG